jgi:hypothetical protein
MENRSEILQRSMKGKNLTVLQASRDLDITPARIYQWLAGDGIPMTRIRFWKIDPEKPEWVRQMAEEMLKEPVGDERAVENG